MYIYIYNELDLDTHTHIYIYIHIQMRIHNYLYTCVWYVYLSLTSIVQGCEEVPGINGGNVASEIQVKHVQRFQGRIL